MGNDKLDLFVRGRRERGQVDRSIVDLVSELGLELLAYCSPRYARRRDVRAEHRVDGLHGRRVAAAKRWWETVNVCAEGVSQRGGYLEFVG